MKKKKAPLIVGNWKQNPATLKRAEKLFVDMQKGLTGRKGDSLVSVAPPVLFLQELKELGGSQKIELITQDVSAYEEGAHTGEISAAQLRSVGIKCAITGHSERRADGETDQVVNKKVHLLRSAKMATIICVGEQERDSSGDYFSVIEDQLAASLDGIKAADLKSIVIAYEPVWAIGTGNNASAQDVEEMKLFIHKVLSDLFGREQAGIVKIIYGGSVTPDNAEELLEIGNVDGFLIGGASLDAKRFVSIVKIADKYARMA